MRQKTITINAKIAMGLPVSYSAVCKKIQFLNILKRQGSKNCCLVSSTIPIKFALIKSAVNTFYQELHLPSKAQ